MCSNERCISEELVCDGLNHCDDNSDEEPHACGKSNRNFLGTPSSSFFIKY